jgi:hypothetical protein
MSTATRSATGESAMKPARVLPAKFTIPPPATKGQSSTRQPLNTSTSNPPSPTKPSAIPRSKPTPNVSFEQENVALESTSSLVKTKIVPSQDSQGTSNPNASTFSMKSLAAALPKTTAAAKTLPANVDIGTYDGGFEDGGDQQFNGVVISAEAEEVLKLDSSTSRYSIRKDTNE